MEDVVVDDEEVEVRINHYFEVNDEDVNINDGIMLTLRMSVIRQLMMMMMMIKMMLR